MDRKTVSLILEYAGYAVLVFAVVWAIMAFLMPDSFLPLKGIPPGPGAGGNTSPFWGNPSTQIPLGALVFLYDVGYLLIGFVTVYIARMVLRRENPGTLTWMIGITAAAYIYKLLSLLPTNPLVAILGAVIMLFLLFALFSIRFVAHELIR
jgi:hypothetical protein